MDAPKPADSSRHRGPHEQPPTDPGAARHPAELIVKDVAFEAMKWLLRYDGDTSRLSEVGLAALEWAGARPDERDRHLIGSAEPERRFVDETDDRAWATKPILKTRGWTEAAIRDFLPEPEGYKPNPRFVRTGAPMPVWLPETVAEAEAAEEWQRWLRKSLRRRGTTLHGLASAADGDFRRRCDGVQEAVESYLRAQIVRSSTGGGGRRAAAG
ncbi:MAG TPA: hypothetical protein VFU12_07200 [Glycomyces sp.]|nr:hypothetical protein [Glycomyces sp.]